MFRDFKVGDLLRMKESSQIFRNRDLDACLVLVTNEHPESSKYFYGTACSNLLREEQLWSYDQFYLLSKASC